MELKFIFSAALILFQILDILLTQKILKNGGTELNPFIRKYGYWIKIPGTAIAIAAGILVHSLVLVPALVLQGGVCVWNYTVLRRIKNGK